jgi:cyclic-di-GMP-binding protein
VSPTGSRLIARIRHVSGLPIRDTADYQSAPRGLRAWSRLIPFASQRELFYASGMPSFDIVSQVNSMEIENAVNQAKKELANRFDFKGSKAEIVLEKNEIKLSAEDNFKVRTLNEMVIGKLAKRSISLKSVEQGEPDISPLGHARQVIKIKQGIETTVAKQITGFIRDGKFKVTTQIQGDSVRVTGKSRDELQAVIAAVRAKEFPVAVQFVNFRD